LRNLISFIIFEKSSGNDHEELIEKATIRRIQGMLEVMNFDSIHHFIHYPPHEEFNHSTTKREKFQTPRGRVITPALKGCRALCSEGIESVSKSRFDSPVKRLVICGWKADGYC